MSITNTGNACMIYITIKICLKCVEFSMLSFRVLSFLVLSFCVEFFCVEFSFVVFSGNRGLVVTTTYYVVPLQGVSMCTDAKVSFYLGPRLLSILG